MQKMRGTREHPSVYATSVGRPTPSICLCVNFFFSEKKNK